MLGLFRLIAWDIGKKYNRNNRNRNTNLSGLFAQGE